MNTIPIEEREPGLICRRASQVEPEPVEWIWPGRVARGKHTCLGGDPGGGKSNLAMFIAAQISTGGEWPCGEGRAPQGSVLILSAEDGAGDTIVPRLHAAKADCDRVHLISAVRTDYRKFRGFDLQADIALLEDKLIEIGDVAAVIVDPISSYLGRTDSHKNAEVRAVLEPLSAMAERTRVAVVSITHFGKAGVSVGAKALHRFIGSIAFVGAPRMAFAVVDDPEDKDRRLLLHVKNNLAPPPPGLAFRLRQTILAEHVMASYVEWERAPVALTANEALAFEADTSVSDAENFLRDLLTIGPVSVKQIQAESEGAGLSWRTVRRAKERLGIAVKRVGGLARDGRWEWHLPTPSMPSLRCPTQKLATLGTLGDFQGLAGDGGAKVANIERGHLSARHSRPCPHCDGEGCSWCRSTCTEAPAVDDMPDIPSFLDRRRRVAAFGKP